MPRKGEKSGVYIKCEYCGKEVYKTKSQYQKAVHHFCSNKCQKLLLHNETYENRKCIICGSSFNVPKLSSQQLCSVDCQKEWQKTRVGKLNPRCTCDEIPCDICGKEILVPQYKIKKGQKNFCSSKCQKIWYANEFSQNKKWKEECRIRSANLLRNNRWVNTKPQLIVNKWLDEMNIKYTNEKTLKYYSLDNYLDDYNLAIEVNGDFWHSNPTIYQDINKLFDVQKNRIPKDKAKRTYCFNKGVYILYLWEKDINNHSELCKNLIQLFIDNNGIIKNYNSFNYYLENGQILLNTNIVYPYFEKYITNA